ncbi:MAG: hypothetical protein ACR2QE_11280 [Acidimicrobiales bacterium]
MESSDARAAAERFTTALADQPLDVALAEILASTLITAFDPIDPILDALVRGRTTEAAGLLSAIAAVADPHSAIAARGAVELLESSGIASPPWSSVTGTALPDEARLVDYRNGAALAVRWRHGDGTTHIMFNVVEDKRIVEVRFTEGDLFEVIEQAPRLSHFTQTDVALDVVGEFLGPTLDEPIRGDGRTWHNAPLARIRYAALGATEPAHFLAPTSADRDDYTLAAMGVDLLTDDRRTSWSGPLW